MAAAILSRRANAICLEEVGADRRDVLPSFRFHRGVREVRVTARARGGSTAAINVVGHPASGADPVAANAVVGPAAAAHERFGISPGAGVSPSIGISPGIGRYCVRRFEQRHVHKLRKRQVGPSASRIRQHRDTTAGNGINQLLARDAKCGCRGSTDYVGTQRARIGSGWNDIPWFRRF